MKIIFFKGKQHNVVDNREKVNSKFKKERDDIGEIILSNGRISRCKITKNAEILNDVNIPISTNTSNFVKIQVINGKPHLTIINEGRVLLINAMKMAFFVPKGEDGRNYKVSRIDKTKGYEFSNLKVEKIGNCGVAKKKRIILSNELNLRNVEFDSVSNMAKYLKIERRKLNVYIKNKKRIGQGYISYKEA